MAIGDDAAAAGMALVAGTTPANQIDTEINLSRDYIAQRTSAVTPITKGGTNATTAAAARTNLGAAASSHEHRIGDILTADGSGPYATALQSALDLKANLAGGADFSSYVTVAGALLNPYARANGVSGWLALGVNASGQFGFQLSSAQFKKDIRDWAPDRQAVLALRLVQFHYRAAYDDGTGDIDHGLIAEEVHDLGLTWLVAYDTDGQPITVRYDRIGLALLSIVQDHEARLERLESS